ncbi:hypothetical protein OPS25_07980 [Alteromonas ponticola]|uniref:Uncharacterized protein n=1 Tax=Alteromonas aquimaris TaxID=2998417 RepID=A0ABT3P6M9_9ALTE|nr:hypothetical protein [Alteromonas aquimaris]MCW8108430.1 hypothetical protein [Alteromonas aquimaris]
MALSPDTISQHNPDLIIKQQIDHQQGMLAEQTKPDAQHDLKPGQRLTPPKNTHQVGLSAFLTAAQMRVLTEDLGFDADAINEGQKSLYAAINHNDLMADGVTLSAGGTIDITAAKGFTVDGGVAGGEGLILRSDRGLDMINLGFFDSDNLLGLQLGGDFTNTLALESKNLWLDITGDITNLGSFTGSDTLSLNAGGDLINQSLISGGAVNLTAKGDIINRSEFSHHTVTDENGNTTTYTEIGDAPQIVSTTV